MPGSGRSTGEGIGYPLQYSWASFVAQLVKNLPAMWETWVRSLGWEDPLEKGKATHSSILAWRIPWTIHGVAKSRTQESDFQFQGGEEILDNCSDGPTPTLRSFLTQRSVVQLFLLQGLLLQQRCCRLDTGPFVCIPSLPSNLLCMFSFPCSLAYSEYFYTHNSFLIMYTSISIYTSLLGLVTGFSPLRNGLMLGGLAKQVSMPSRQRG